MPAKRLDFFAFSFNDFGSFREQEQEGAMDIYYIFDIIGELLNNMYHSSLRGYIGVNAIYGYLTLMVIVGVWRIFDLHKKHH
jgi:hypothetical protein